MSIENSNDMSYRDQKWVSGTRYELDSIHNMRISMTCVLTVLSYCILHTCMRCMTWNVSWNKSITMFVSHTWNKTKVDFDLQLIFYFSKLSFYFKCETQTSLLICFTTHFKFYHATHTCVQYTMGKYCKRTSHWDSHIMNTI